MTNRIRKSFGLTVLLCMVLLIALAVPASAASYSKIYGKTMDRIRVRESASSSAATIDNLVKDRCVYILQSKESGGVTWIQVKYRSHEGGIETGWVAQNDGKTTYVKILSTTQAKSEFNVSDGDIPKKIAGAWSSKEREAAKTSASSSSSSSSSSTSTATIKEVQSKLKALGIYSGEITGNVGSKTTAAIKEFQRRNGLTADGVLGPATLAKLESVNASSSSSSSASTDTIKDVQAKLKNMGIYSGEITGTAGTKTTAAIKEFQKRYGLTVDGVAGSETVSKLNQVYSSSSTVKVSSSSTTGLGLGSSGTAVAQLQQNLTTLGYYWAEITGNFGSKTEAAVKAFQKANGLTQDGVAGSSTLTAINNAVAKKGGSTSTTTMTTSGTLQLNSTGSAVTALQTNLKALGFYSGEITGHYGEKTRDAVIAYQKKNNLTADGIAGSATLKAIASSAASKASSTGTATSASGTSSSTLSVGSTGSAVRNLQTNLTTLGYYYGDITGHFGSQTSKAVSAYQKAKGLSQTGTASPTLQTRIANETGSSNTTTVTTRVSLKKGDSGSDVTALQNALNKLGYYKGSITGNYGDLTAAAVRKFQDANDLTVDGIAGSKTIAAINKAAGSSVTINTSTTTTTSGSSSLTSYARVSVNKAILRKQASATSASVAQLVAGTQMKISKRVTSGGFTWYYVEAYQDYTYKGYIRSDLVTVISYSDFRASSNYNSTSDDEVIGVLEVLSSNLAVREGPSTNDEIAYRANYGDIYTYIDYENGWYKLYDGNWVNGSYVTTSVDSSKYSYNDTTSYRYGDTDDMVSTIQEWLTALKYYKGGITGHYGSQTVDAVESFQSDHGLTSDGIAGPKTIAALQRAIAGGSGSYTVGKTVYNVDWFKAKASGDTFKNIGFTAGSFATLTDLTTGISLRIRVQSTGNHMDAEPVTASDTAKFCSIYGVSSAGYITSSSHWQRRPMLIDTGIIQAVCSMYGVPHGQQYYTNNNYPGQFCLHFLDSKTSGTKKVDSGHQNAISRAITLVKNKDSSVNILTLITYP